MSVILGIGNWKRSEIPVPMLKFTPPEVPLRWQAVSEGTLPTGCRKWKWAHGNLHFRYLPMLLFFLIYIFSINSGPLDSKSKGPESSSNSSSLGTAMLPRRVGTFFFSIRFTSNVLQIANITGTLNFRSWNRKFRFRWDVLSGH